MGGWADGRRVEGELTSIDRTAYPRFRRSVPMKELQESFSPSESEINWARERTRTPEHLLALLLLLKAFQRLGCFPDLFEVPLSIVDHVRGVLGQASAVVAEHASSRSGERHRAWIRERLQVVFDPPAAERLARQVISDAATAVPHLQAVRAQATSERSRARAAAGIPGGCRHHLVQQLPATGKR